MIGVVDDLKFGFWSGIFECQGIIEGVYYVVLVVDKNVGDIGQQMGVLDYLVRFQECLIYEIVVFDLG